MKNIWRDITSEQQNASLGLRRLVLIISMASFVLCLHQPAFVCEHKEYPSYSGYEVLALGWIAALGFEPRWFANLFLLKVWRWLLLPSRYAFPRYSIVFIIASAVSAHILTGGMGCYGQDSLTSVVGLDTGGYLWTFALIVATVGAIGVRMFSGNRDTTRKSANKVL